MKGIKKKPFISIRKKIIFLFLAMMFLVLAGVSSFYLVYFSRILTARVEDDQQILMEGVRINVENFIETVNQATTYFYVDKKFAELCSRLDSDIFLNTRTQKELNESFKLYLRSPSMLQDCHAALFLYPNVPIAAFMEDGDLSVLKKDRNLSNCLFKSSRVEEEEWFIRTEKSEGRFQIFMLPEWPESLFIARQIKNTYLLSSGSPKMGVLVMVVPLTKFSKQLNVSSLTPGSRIFLVNRQQKVVYSNETDAAGAALTDFIDPKNMEKLVMDGSARGQNMGEASIMNRYDLDWGLKLVSIIPYKDITSSLDKPKAVGFMVSVISILLAAGISLIVSSKISGNIVRLSRNMQRVTQKGDLDITLQTESNDEVGQLYKSFNDMIQRIKKLIQDVYEGTQEQKRLELCALQAQINPHFVYNTLDSVNWIALCNGEEEIVNMVSALAGMLRYSLNDPEGIVELAGELENVHNYIGIQEIRYDRNFTIEYDIEKKARRCRIPKFVIQPLVENALLHGVERTGGGNILVSARLSEGVLCIDVKDNGGGADVEEMNNYLEGKSSSLPESDGFGIGSVQKRIRLCYGDSYGLTFEQNDTQGVTAHIRLPEIYI